MNPQTKNDFKNAIVNECRTVGDVLRLLEYNYELEQEVNSLVRTQLADALVKLIEVTNLKQK